MAEVLDVRLRSGFSFVVDRDTAEAIWDAIDQTEGEGFICIRDGNDEIEFILELSEIVIIIA
jgi:hypothetical protein